MAKYTVSYTGNSIHPKVWESDSRDSLRHLKEHFASAGNDTVTVYETKAYKSWDGDSNTAPIVSMSLYSPERGGRFFRCYIPKD